MPRDTLRETLTRLHTELHRAPTLDPELREDLERTLAEIRDVIEDDERAAHEKVPLIERLETLALGFERSHPLLTEAIGGVVRALGAMGI